MFSSQTIEQTLRGDLHCADDLLSLMNSGACESYSGMNVHVMHDVIIPASVIGGMSRIAESVEHGNSLKYDDVRRWMLVLARNTLPEATYSAICKTGMSAPEIAHLILARDQTPKRLIVSLCSTLLGACLKENGFSIGGRAFTTPKVSPEVIVRGYVVNTAATEKAVLKLRPSVSIEASDVVNRRIMEAEVTQYRDYAGLIPKRTDMMISAWNYAICTYTDFWPKLERSAMIALMDWYKILFFGVLNCEPVSSPSKTDDA